MEPIDQQNGWILLEYERGHDGIGRFEYERAYTGERRIVTRKQDPAVGIRLADEELP